MKRIVLDLEGREQLRRLVDQQPPEHDAAAIEALRIAKAIADEHLIEAEGINAGDLGSYKLCGYNACLYERAVFAGKVRRAIDAVLADDPIEVVHDLPDVRLAEAALGQAAEQRGGRWARELDGNEIARLLEAKYPPVSSSPNFEPHEIGVAPSNTDSSSRSEADIVAVASMPNYLNPIIPTLEACMERGYTTALIAPAALLRRASEGCRVIAAESLTSLAPDVQATIRDEQRLAELCRPFGIDVWPLMKRDIATMTTTVLADAAKQTLAARQLFTTLNPRVLITVRLRRAFERAVHLAATEQGARTLLIPHGNLGSEPLRELDDGPFNTADRVCAWGADQARTIHAKLSAPTHPHTLVITGNPAWDTLAPIAADRLAHRAAITKALNLDPKRPITVWTSQNNSQDALDLVAASAANAKTQLVLKIHPREDTSHYHTRYPDVPIAPANLNLHHLLAAADAVLTFSSTTAIEAILLGTPVITVQTDSMRSLPRLVDAAAHGLPLARTRTDLDSIFAELDADPSHFRATHNAATKRAAEDWAAFADTGTAASNVADQVEQLLHAQRTVQPPSTTSV
ncbi:MAG: hypothetical protein AAGI17_02525 [Planctomycetota bacterium]